LWACLWFKYFFRKRGCPAHHTAPTRSGLFLSPAVKPLVAGDEEVQV
jgi:hypothetical protein